jgi:uncharacterized protein involved in type VI secretion and phage assembly
MTRGIMYAPVAGHSSRQARFAYTANYRQAIADLMTQALHSQAGAVMKVDSIDRWLTETRWSTNAIELRSWDCRAVNDRPVSSLDAGDAPLLTSRDTPGALRLFQPQTGPAYRRASGRSIGRRAPAARAAGTVRTLSPGTTFTLHGHAPAEETGHIVLVSRFDIARRGIYPRHSLAAQCNESNCLHRMI